MHPLFIRIFIFLFYLNFSGFNSYSQQTEVVDFLKIDAEIKPDYQTQSILGKIRCEFKILKNTESVYLDAHNMRIHEFHGINEVSETKDKIFLKHNFQKDSVYSVTFTYEGRPKQTFYFIKGKKEMWTQGQGKYTSHWLPSLDDARDKIIFNLTIKTDSNLTAIANGKLIEITVTDKSKKWKHQMSRPMSSYLVAVAIGNYEKKEFTSASGIPIELYYKPEHKEEVEATYRYSKEIFDFLEKEIGVPYPWEIYKQVPVRDFLYAGMENTTATFFAESFMVDDIGFNDRNYINVNAHELAHQWFGNLVTALSDEHHWLQEGFSTYYALLAELEIFGKDYYDFHLYQKAVELQEKSDAGKGEFLLNPKAGSLTFYDKGAWALHFLKERAGEEKFKEAVRNYLNKYAFKNATTDDFLSELNIDPLVLDDFKQNWLESKTFPAEEAYQSLMKSEFIKEYFRLLSLQPLQLSHKKNFIEKLLDSDNEILASEAVFHLYDWENQDMGLWKKALENEKLKVRKNAVMILDDLQPELLPVYKTLLGEESYEVQAAVLYQLWSNFPEERISLLEKTKNKNGLYNKNIRQLWLTLALMTDNYEPGKKLFFYQELIEYSSPAYGFEIRQVAFEFISNINLWTEESLYNLIEATGHPAWRFSSFSKNLLSEVLSDDKNLRLLSGIAAKLTPEEKERVLSLFPKD